MHTVQVVNAMFNGSTVNVYGVTQNCWKCRRPWLCSLSYGEVSGLGASNCGSSVGVNVDTTWGYLTLDVRHEFVIELTDAYGVVMFDETLSLKEHSVHTIITRQNQDTSVLSGQIVQDLEGDNIWIPLIVGVCTVAGVAIAYTLISACWASKTDADDAPSASSRDASNIQVKRAACYRMLKFCLVHQCLNL